MKARVTIRRYVQGCGIAALLCVTACAQTRPVAGPPSGKTVDLRPAFRKLELSVRPQGKRGTCSVFTVVGALEFAFAKKDGKCPPLSVEFANWASNQATGDRADGSYFSDLWAGYVAYGICEEAVLPYRPKYDPDLEPSPEVRKKAEARRLVGLRIGWIKRWNVERGLTDEEFADVKTVLEQGWPVCGGFRWPKKASWTKGVLDMRPPEGVFDGHSIVLEGYRDDSDQPGGGVFLIRNSGSGERHSAMSYAYAQAYMNDAVYFDVRPPKGTVEKDRIAR